MPSARTGGGILERKRLTVPSMLLFVGALTDSEMDLVKHASDVVACAEAFLDSGARPSLAEGTRHGCPAGSLFGRQRPRDVPFSELPRARRMKVEAEKLAKKPSRRADGTVLDTGRRFRIEKLLEQVEKLPRCGGAHDKLSADGWGVLGVTIVGIVAASFLGLRQAEVQKKQAEVQEKQAEVQEMVAKWQRDDFDAKAQTRAEKMRHTAAQVHECAADAFTFAKQAHFEAVRSNYRSARPLSLESMERMRDAHAAALREQQSDGKHPPLSTLLDAPLRNERLVMWRAVTLYYAASTVLHSLDEEAVAIDGGVRSAAERRLRFEDAVNTARSWLVQARARAAHIDAKVLGTWEPDLAHRIDLRLADASSYWHAVLGDKVAATQVYEDMGRKLEDASRAPGPEPRKARLLSNHAMALFGLATPEGDAGARKRLTVPSMLLFVGALTDSEMDLVKHASDVVACAEAFLDSGRDRPWLRARGMVRVLDALFVALEHCPSRMPAGSLFGRQRPRDVPFSELPRARRMKVEAEKLAKKPSRRADGTVLDTGLRFRIEKLLEQVEKLA
ncbi:hypothetical protein FNF28_04100 [Cafeteria roenbergensis]|uniref:Uncharacterized protein n=1 Tax=Cafeteria roenbergensis TaxID=33653 RepID=A0A5A8DFD0_CAFRO|nr:hypothetical protein FNF28_04100 [Cafeteria roenbergensis]